ncbi:MAG: hypothetical protein Q8O68_00810 [Candidatus Daviesbacteria bacterium]|nr:hypothetical protein [Candidatus Daviesbacteria bacterium]
MALLNLTNERPDAQIADLLRATLTAARTEFAPLQYEGEYPQNGFGLAELRARHVGIATDFWQMTVTTAFANWINKTLGTDVFIVITGVFNLTVDPSTSELFPSANGKDLPYLNIEQMYADANQSKAWLTKPFGARPSNNLTIQAIGRFAQTERLGLLGYAVAKRSYLITASP